MELKAIKNHIIFKFEDDVINGKFNETNDWGFVIAASHNDDATIKGVRWGVPVSVGPDAEVDGIVPFKTRILIEPLMWSEGFDFEGQRLWRTDTTRVMGFETIE